MFRDQMRTKSFLLLLLCIILTSSLVYLIGNDTPTFAHTFVSDAHRKIVTDLKRLNTEIRSRKQLSVADQRYLTDLGFVSSPKLYPHHPFRNVTPPVFVTSVTPSHYTSATNWIRSFMKHIPDSTLIVYGVDLSSSQNKELKTQCNCTYRVLDFNSYPSHVSTLSLGVYVPIIIQECLRDYGGVIWIDMSYHLTQTPSPHLLTTAEKIGLQAWLTPGSLDSTSAYTHSKMFEFFNYKPQDYYFQRMFSTESLIIFNLPLIHRNLLLPWLECALVEHCISPVGSQASGCVIRRPRYLYTGCHRYKTSAFNLALGNMLNHSTRAMITFTADSSYKFTASDSELEDIYRAKQQQDMRSRQDDYTD